jgi:HEAT repeat protein
MKFASSCAVFIALAIVLLSAYLQFAQDTEPKRATVVEVQFVELRYTLPEQEDAAGKSTAARWGVGAPVENEISHPTKIIYDQAYIEKYVDWMMQEHGCGSAEYWIVTPHGERTVQGGLDEVYLGRRFAADDLVEFLKSRVEGKRAERTFRGTNEKAVKVLRGQTGSAKRLEDSPWDNDTRSVITLLGLAEYGPARPYLAALAKEENSATRYVAAIALGRVARADAKAVDDLETLLGNEATRSEAATGLVAAGKSALPVLLRALDHRDKVVRNQVVHAMAGADDAVSIPVLRQGMAHADSELRERSVTTVVDWIQRRGPESGKPFVNDLATLLCDDTNVNTRRGAALALENMKSFAAPAKAALARAAEKEGNSKVGEFAKMALEEIEKGTK